MTETWPDEIFQILVEHQIQQIAYVPDSGHARLISLCCKNDPMRSIPLTTEEEGVALLAGAWLGGERGCLLTQSSGVGNCLNMLSLTHICRMPLLILVTMRGQWSEFNPWQVPLGQTTAKLLTLADVVTFPVDDETQVAETVEAAVRMAFQGSVATAVLISQRILDRKTFGR